MMSTFSKALKQLIEAGGELNKCCNCNNDSHQCEFDFADEAKYTYPCRAFNLCMEKYSIKFDELINPYDAKFHFEYILNQMLQELIIE